MQRRHFLSTGVGGAACVASGAVAATFAIPAQAAKQSPQPAPLPPGYAAMGRRFGVPPLVLYGVALQESKMGFGEQALPYPWTLCVRGEARRYPSYDLAVHGLQQSVAAGITNVDCGCMQVNWGWHSGRLGSFHRALDPYLNIEVGAQILREHYDTTHDWFKAVGMYHHPTDIARARRYAESVFLRIPQIPGLGASSAEARRV
ncbi:MAG: transglycosylase SLT domain-containing protein [Burkholderiales bacterium]|nr:transglycosylase SLT domain-containing protein [Burkholderiales bacterium]